MPIPAALAFVVRVLAIRGIVERGNGVKMRTVGRKEEADGYVDMLSIVAVKQWGVSSTRRNEVENVLLCPVERK